MKHGAVMSTGSNRMVTWNTLLVYQERYLLKCVAWCKLSDIPEEQSASIFRVKQWAQQVTSMKHAASRGSLILKIGAVHSSMTAVNPNQTASSRTPGETLSSSSPM